MGKSMMGEEQASGLDRLAPDEALVSVGCPSCQSDRSRLVLHGRDRLFGRPGWYRVVQCAECDLKYVNPRPTGEALAIHYPPDYLPVRRPEDTPAPFRGLGRFLIGLRWAVYLKMVERVIGPIPAEARVVDVGCGMNELLLHLREKRGCVGTGIDINADASAYIRDTLRMPFVQGTLLDAHLEADSVDLITMNQYLEHETDPRAVLLEARRISKKGAHLIVEVPFASGIPARLFGSCWSQLDVPRHLTFYTRETVTSMLERCNYRVIHTASFGAPFSAALSVLQSLGLTRLGRPRVTDIVLILLVGTLLLPFFPWLHEFVLVVATPSDSAPE
jgi:SAM-dependent methyltransferase